jgi:hypothetical protein
MSFKRELGVDVDMPGELALKVIQQAGGFIRSPARQTARCAEDVAEQQVDIVNIGVTTVEPRLRMNGVIDVAVSVAVGVGKWVERRSYS